MVNTDYPPPNPPKNEPISRELLAQHSGEDPTKPVWVAVKGTVFDVSRNRVAYGMTTKKKLKLKLN